MIRKKHWPKPSSLKVLNRTKTNDIDISWSSSSSDADSKVGSYFNRNRKKLKTTKINSKRGEITPTKYDYNSDLSPIIGKNVPEELSPTLNSRDDNELDKSPIIGKHFKARRWKKRVNSTDFRNKFRTFIRHQTEHNHGNHLNISMYSSSDSSETEDSISISQLTNITTYSKIESLSKAYNSSDDELHNITQDSSIILSQFHKEDIDINHVETQNTSPNTQQVIISQYSSSRDSPILISQNATQNKPDLLSNSSADITATSLLTSSVFLYQKPPRRKRYKKNGLAKQLQRCLKHNEASISIWKHELYLNKNHFKDMICLEVTIMHKEFQNTIFECTLSNVNSNNNNSTCVVVLSNSILNTDTCPNELKLYKPYSESIINWCGRNVDCYYNICRILFDS